MACVDLNADLGETVDGVPTADDEALFAVISSANIACGAHAGDAASMRLAVDRAARFGVAVGAHPSYPDRAGFGRRRIDMTGAQLCAVVSQQLDALEAAGGDIRYVKPHGALYHAVTTDRAHADAVVRAIAQHAERRGTALSLLGMRGEIEHAAAAAGIPMQLEAFLDRGYRADGRLVPRGESGALVTDPQQVAARAVRWVSEGTIDTVDGGVVHVEAVSLCVHGDSPASVAMARRVRSALDAAGVAVRSPW